MLKVIRRIVHIILFGKEACVFYIGNCEALPEPLTPIEEQACFDMLDTSGDGKARGILIEHNLRLVVYIAKRFENTNVNIEDLISIGTIGLIKAIRTFNTDKNIKLATYASRCIENEILMYLRKTVKEKLEVSIDEPLNIDWDGNELLLADVLGTDDDIVSKNLEAEVEWKILYEALGSLNSREKQIIGLRYGIFTDEEEELTQKEVADMLGISQSYISRLEKKIMKKLKREMLLKMT